MYWSPLGSHSVAPQLHSSLNSADWLPSYYSPCCHLVRKLPSFSCICLSELGAQLREANTGAEGHQGGQSVLYDPFQQSISFSHPFYSYSMRMSYLNTYQVFLGYQDVFTVVLFTVHWIKYQLIIISILPLLRKFWCLSLLCVTAVIFLIWRFFINLV